MSSDDSITSNENIQIGAEGAEGFVRRFLDLNASDAPVFLVTGHQSYENSGAASFFASILADRKVVRFSDFTPNPKIEHLICAIDAFQASESKLIISIGGGSSIDLAKLVNYFSSEGINPDDYIEGKRGSGEAFTPHLSVPTTAGTGSEATHFAALYIGFDKVSITGKGMAPSHIWLNPAFTASMSPYLTACTGFDALAQAIESYWAVGSTLESRKNGAKALQLCLRHLERAVLKPTFEHRAGMLEAAHLSGRAINVSKTTAAHAMSYALTAHYGLPHGHAVAMTLPAVFEANASFKETDLRDPRSVEHLRVVMNELCNLFSVDTSQKAIQKTIKLIATIGLSHSWFSDHGFDYIEARKYIMQELNEERLANNPRILDRNLIAKIVSCVR